MKSRLKDKASAKEYIIGQDISPTKFLHISEDVIVPYDFVVLRKIPFWTAKWTFIFMAVMTAVVIVWPSEKSLSFRDCLEFALFFQLPTVFLFVLSSLTSKWIEINRADKTFTIWMGPIRKFGVLRRYQIDNIKIVAQRLFGGGKMGSYSYYIVVHESGKRMIDPFRFYALPKKTSAEEADLLAAEIDTFIRGFMDRRLP